MLTGWLESAVSQPARKLTLSCAALAMFVCLAQGRAESAQQDLHASVSSDGQILAATESGAMTSPGFDGTGIESGSGSDVSKRTESAADVWSLWEAAPASAPIGRESILGPDNRTRVRPTTAYPARAIALITFNTASGGGSRCTGWLINANTVATAGHCVHGGAGSTWHQLSSFRVYPGRNGTASPYGSCTVTRAWTTSGWIGSSADTADYGALKLNCSIGNTVGWIGYFWTNASLLGLPATVSGYPGDKPLTQWRHTDQVRVAQANRVFYAADTIGGQSGSPVYYNRSGCGQCAMAVHAYGVYGSFPFNTYNHGTRITRAVFNNLNAWKNAP